MNTNNMMTPQQQQAFMTQLHQPGQMGASLGQMNQPMGMGQGSFQTNMIPQNNNFQGFPQPQNAGMTPQQMMQMQSMQGTSGPGPMMASLNNPSNNISMSKQSLDNLSQSLGNDPSGPQKKQSLKVTLNPKERGFYSNLLMQADPEGNNKVAGQQAVAFFKRSGLPVDVLKSIWLTSARTSNEYLTRDEFYVALRLIAYAQHGIQPNEDSIRFNLDVELPRMDPAPLALPPSEKDIAKPEVRAEDMARMLPDLDNLNIHALDSIQSLIPSVNMHEQQKQAQQAQQQAMKQQQMMQRQMLEKAKQSQWFIAPEDHQRYLKIFEHFDKEKQGFIGEGHMRQVFDQTKLEKPICDQVWRLVNPRGAERFDKRMFSLAMHFLYKKKQGADLPNQVPEETYMSLDGDQYFALAQQRMQQQAFNQPQPQSQVQQPQQNLLDLNSMDNFVQNPVARQGSMSQGPHNQPQIQRRQPSVDMNRSPNQQQNLIGLGESPVKNQSFKASPQPFQAQSQSNSSQNRSQASSPGRTMPIRIDPSKIQVRKDEIQFANSLYKQDQHMLYDIQNENMKLQKQLDDLDQEFQSIKQKIEQQRRILEQERERNQGLKTQIDIRQTQVSQYRDTYESLVNERLQLLEGQNQAKQQYTSNNNSSFHGYSEQPVQSQKRDSFATNTNNNGYAAAADNHGYGNGSQNHAAYGDYNNSGNNYGYNNDSYKNDGHQYQQNQSYGANNDYSHQAYDAQHHDSYGHQQTTTNYDQHQYQQTQPASSGFNNRFDFDNFDSELNHGAGSNGFQDFSNKFDFS